MKTSLSVTSVILIAAVYFSISSCQKDYLIPEPVLIPDTVSFNEHIIPIFTDNCISSGCHNTGGIAPDLSSANAFNSLTLYGLTNTDNPETSVIYTRMAGTNKPMPPSGKLPEAKLQLVLKWIEQGALDN